MYKNILVCFLSSFFEESGPELDETESDFPLLASCFLPESFSESLSNFLSSFLEDVCALETERKTMNTLFHLQKMSVFNHFFHPLVWQLCPCGTPLLTGFTGAPFVLCFIFRAFFLERIVFGLKSMSRDIKNVKEQH